MKWPQPHGHRKLTVRCLWLIQSSPSLIEAGSGNRSTKMGRSLRGTALALLTGSPDGWPLKQELVKEGGGFGDILPRTPSPFHDSERRRKRVHFRKLNISIARKTALNSRIRYSVPIQRAFGVGARRHCAPDSPVGQRDAHT